MSTVLAIDPGSTRSAWVMWLTGSGRRGGQLGEFGIDANDALRRRLPDLRAAHPGALLVIEYPRAYTIPGGKDRRFFPQEVIDTAYAAGLLVASWGSESVRVGRHDVKRTLCGGGSGFTDAHVRAAILARFGGDREHAIGTRAAPGPLYGLRADLWAALALVVAWQEGCGAEPTQIDPEVSRSPGATRPETAFRAANAGRLDARDRGGR